MKNAVIVALMAVIAAISCSRQDELVPGNGGEGFLRLSISHDFGVVEVKAPEEDPVFKVVVTDYETGVVVKTVEDHHTLVDEPISLAEGRYIVVAGFRVVTLFRPPCFAFHLRKDALKIEIVDDVEEEHRKELHDRSSACVSA